MIDLKLPPETEKALAEITLPDMQEWKNEFWADSLRFHTFAKSSPDGLSVLKIYQLAVQDMAEHYAARHIPETVLEDSLLDFGIWCRDYLKKTGRPGLAEWQWLGLTLRERLFRLGRLQFEPSVLAYPVGDCLAGTPVLEVHIPAEAPLDMELVRQSLAQAPAFFEQYFGKRYTVFHCHSWLLSPQLGKLLPPESRIMQFQSLFDIAAWNENDRQAEERVFGMLKEQPAEYPSDTSLQKSMKRFLQDGGRLGVGHGLRRI